MTIDPKVQELMDAAKNVYRLTFPLPNDWSRLFEAIKALEPPPLDPDILVVRAVLHAYQRSMSPPDSGWGDMSYEKGSYDHIPAFQAALAAYKKVKS